MITQKDFTGKWKSLYCCLECFHLLNKTHDNDGRCPYCSNKGWSDIVIPNICFPAKILRVSKAPEFIQLFFPLLTLFWSFEKHYLVKDINGVGYLRKSNVPGDQIFCLLEEL